MDLHFRHRGGGPPAATPVRRRRSAREFLSCRGPHLPTNSPATPPVSSCTTASEERWRYHKAATP